MSPVRCPNGRAGAKGLVLKESAPQLLIACLRAVAAGQVWFSEEVPAIVSRQGEQKRLWRERFESLTEREIEVVRLANAGASNKEIAYALQLVEGTVKVHLNNIFRKLQERDGLDEAALVAPLATTPPGELTGDNGHELWSLVLEAARLDEVVEQVVAILFE